MTDKSPELSAMKPALSDFEDRALSTLREHGFRITSPRLQVIRILAASPRALSANDIYAAIKAQGNQIDSVSVYRILATLADMHLVHHVGVADGYMACGMGDAHGEDSEHVVCSSCGNVVEAQMPAVALEATLAQLATLGFKASAIKLEVEGECRQCGKD